MKIDKLIGFLNEYINNMEERINKVWKGATSCPVSLYSKKENIVLIAGINRSVKGFMNKNDVLVGEWNNYFMGNTNITFDGTEIAIVNLDYNNLDDNELISLLHHEAFHVFQKKSSLWYKSEPNDMLSSFYPLNLENLLIREEERRLLYKIVLEKDENKSIEYINMFISLREKRKGIIGIYFDYELKVETMEGTATFVEKQIYELLGGSYLDYYEKTLNNNPKDLKNFRATMYSSGSALCHILKRFDNNWEIDFLKNDLSIYDYFKSLFKIRIVEVSYKENKELNQIFINEKNNRKNEIDRFYQSNGTKIIINIDGIQLNGFDPMNMIKFEYKIFHKHFIIVKIKDRTLQLNVPSIAEITGDNYFKINKLITIVENKSGDNNKKININNINDLEKYLSENSFESISISNK